MFGAIAGDVIGSAHEGRPPGLKDFTLLTSRSVFTDDTVLTIAVASAILDGQDFGVSIRKWGKCYPNAGYGHGFYTWLNGSDVGPYNSYGNGSAMRVSPVGWAFNDLHSVAAQAGKSAVVTHNHPEGMKGAQAIATAVFAARMGHTKQQIAKMLSSGFGYDLEASHAKIRDGAISASTCQETVPAAAIAFLLSNDFEDAIRNAVFFGGDTDTTACITGAIAEAFYGGVPQAIEEEVRCRLDKEMLRVVDTFTRRFCKKSVNLTVVSNNR